MEIRCEKAEGEYPVEKIRETYMSAYGGRTPMSFDTLLSSRKNELLAFYDGETFVGFAFVLRHGGADIALYMAVPEELRRKGYGTAMAEDLKVRYAGERIVLLPFAPGVGDRMQNSRYTVLKHLCSIGYADTLSRFTFLGSDYQIMCCGEPVSREEIGDAVRSMRRRGTH